jgi:hypothetical protein
MAIAPRTPSSTTFSFQGKILRKKKVIPNLLRVNIQCTGDEHTTPIYVPLDKSDEICNGFNLFYLEAIIQVGGYIASDDVTNGELMIVESCQLVTCAPNVKMIKDMLQLPNILEYAPCFNTDMEELQLLLKKPQKAVIHEVLSNLNGVGKAPPRQRLARLKFPDMQILQSKEQQDTNKEWTLCEPCNASFHFEPRKQSVSNLPEGAEDSISHHHKLTRGQYLENKKNNQTLWFVERMKQFNSTPKCVLDVGGGRGDLAVQIALEFKDTRVIAVDCNKSSVDAGKVYARQCGVEDRIEFVEMNFSQYVEEYDASTDKIDCVVALHACGDLSDMALSLAHSIGTSFIICPCCYPKRYLAPFVPYWHQHCTEDEVDSLTRLVELDDRREVSRRAMIVINSMRRSAFDENVRLEEFECKISRRNIALVGDSKRDVAP